MRLQLTLTRVSKQRMLPMDYQYYVGAWIYRMLNAASSETASFLHDSGYAYGNKKFKLFAHSPLELRPYTMWQDKCLFEVKGDTVSLQVGFAVQPDAEKFIKGLFEKQFFYLGDKFNGIDLMVNEIQEVPKPAFRETMKYRLLSPAVISGLPDGRRYSQYLGPEDDYYAIHFLRHLREKMKGQLVATADETELVELDAFEFRSLSKSRKKGFVIKPHTLQMSRIIGFRYDFELTAPLEYHQLAWDAGFGEKNVHGFGWAEIIK